MTPRATAMQASARHPDPDMFPADPAGAGLVVEIRGELISAAEVRTKLVGVDQRTLPVLCVDVRPLTGFNQTIHAEQVYSEATRKLAEQKAATLKKGARITLTTVLQDMRTFLPHVQSVQLNP